MRRIARDPPTRKWRTPGLGRASTGAVRRGRGARHRPSSRRPRTTSPRSRYVSTCRDQTTVLDIGASPGRTGGNEPFGPEQSGEPATVVPVASSGGANSSVARGLLLWVSHDEADRSVPTRNGQSVPDPGTYGRKVYCKVTLGHYWAGVASTEPMKSVPTCESRQRAPTLRRSKPVGSDAGSRSSSSRSSLQS